MNLLVTILLATVPMDPFIVAESVDQAESNAVWRCDWSERQFSRDQWIWRRDSEIIGWQWDENTIVTYHPNRVYVTDGRRVRILRPLGIIGTISNHDRENVEREWLPESKRKGLAK